MKIKKGTALIVNDRRKGRFRGEATADFDTESDTFYPIATKEYVSGMANEWFPGDEIPCRKGISEIQIEE